VVSIFPPNVISSYVIFVGYGTNKKRRKCFLIIWLTFVWVIWKAISDSIFNNEMAIEADVIDSIQRMSWLWFMNSVAKSPCLLYEWV
jgi:hypothetical protein